jgi:hypothetical protein
MGLAMAMVAVAVGKVGLINVSFINVSYNVSREYLSQPNVEIF